MVRRQDSTLCPKNSLAEQGSELISPGRQGAIHELFSPLVFVKVSNFNSFSLRQMFAEFLFAPGGKDAIQWIEGSMAYLLYMKDG